MYPNESKYTSGDYIKVLTCILLLIASMYKKEGIHDYIMLGKYFMSYYTLARAIVTYRAKYKTSSFSF